MKPSALIGGGLLLVASIPATIVSVSLMLALTPYFILAICVWGAYQWAHDLWLTTTPKWQADFERIRRADYEADVIAMRERGWPTP